MNVSKIQKKLKDFAKEREWEKFHNLKNLAISISIEASELMEIFQWEDSKSIFWKKKKNFKQIEHEVADVMLYLLRFADIAKIDIEKVCVDKIKINSHKYPVNKSKGRSTKYNKL